MTVYYACSPCVLVFTFGIGHKIRPTPPCPPSAVLQGRPVHQDIYVSTTRSPVPAVRGAAPAAVIKHCDDLSFVCVYFSRYARVLFSGVYASMCDDAYIFFLTACVGFFPLLPAYVIIVAEYITTLSPLPHPSCALSQKGSVNVSISETVCSNAQLPRSRDLEDDVCG